MALACAGGPLGEVAPGTLPCSTAGFLGRREVSRGRLARHSLLSDSAPRILSEKEWSCGPGRTEDQQFGLDLRTKFLDWHGRPANLPLSPVPGRLVRRPWSSKPARNSSGGGFGAGAWLPTIPRRATRPLTLCTLIQLPCPPAELPGRGRRTAMHWRRTFGTARASRSSGRAGRC